MASRCTRSDNKPCRISISTRNRAPGEAGKTSRRCGAGPSHVARRNNGWRGSCPRCNSPTRAAPSSRVVPMRLIPMLNAPSLRRLACTCLKARSPSEPRRPTIHRALRPHHLWLQGSAHRSGAPSPGPRPGPTARRLAPSGGPDPLPYQGSDIIRIKSIGYYIISPLDRNVILPRLTTPPVGPIVCKTAPIDDDENDNGLD
jgi:hypothetical protein